MGAVGIEEIRDDPAAYRVAVRRAQDAQGPRAGWWRALWLWVARSNAVTVRLAARRYQGCHGFDAAWL